MQNIGTNNLLSIFTGAAIIVTCVSIAYFFQKNLFGRYKGKVKNTMNKGDKSSS